ncbi:MAG: hypothetical protein H6830_04545 [Planctomycetes bacterium]|nr:hypothetical protein [Planctomycetota bacterium]MCB9910513.1 hypothetical protein [Planctomycetota bacterium]MCB9912639.1 hypothetical protein [Planctomycetota bacterium]HRV80846.1 hypothetical protein [Planctomycetota bacterium]
MDTQTSTSEDLSAAAPATQTGAPEQSQGDQQGTQGTTTPPAIDQAQYESAVHSLRRLQFSPEMISSLSDEQVVQWSQHYAPLESEKDDAFRARAELARLKETQRQTPEAQSGSSGAGDFKAQITAALGEEISQEAAARVADVLGAHLGSVQERQIAILEAQTNAQIEAVRSTLLPSMPELRDPGMWMQTKEMLRRIAPGFGPNQGAEAVRIAASIVNGLTPQTRVVPNPNKQTGQIPPPNRTGSIPATPDAAKLEAARRIAQKHFGRN